jgi:hypothetical protein
VRQRLPLIFSATALVVSLFGATPVGQAATNAVRAAVPLALFANNAGKLNGHTSSTAPKGGQIPVLDGGGNLPAAILGRAAGALAAKLTVVAGPQTSLGVAEVTTLTAACPAGSSLIAGGYDVHLIEAGDPRVDRSQPDSKTQSWQVDVYNIPVIDPATQKIATHTGRGRAFAVCVRT